MNYTQTDTDGRCGVKCLSWTAVIAGALVAIGLGFLLNLFGIAIGLTAFTTSPEGAKVLAVGGYIGMAIGVMAVFFTAGAVAGSLGRAACVSYGANPNTNTHVANCNLGVLYGFSAWVLTLIISVALTSSVGQFMAMQYDALTDPGMVAVNITSSKGTTAISASRESMSAKDNAKNTTQVTVNDEKAAKALGKTLFLIFLLFLVGAITASFGGYVGMHHCYRDRNKK